VDVFALKNHQAQLCSKQKAFFFESSCLLEANNKGQILSCIISPDRENK
jgi:hypothetical protein